MPNCTGFVLVTLVTQWLLFAYYINTASALAGILFIPLIIAARHPDEVVL